MSQPLVFVTTHTVNDGQVDAVKELALRFTERAQAAGGGLVSYHHFLDEEAAKVTNVQVHADAASMDASLSRSQELIAEVLPIAPAHSIEVYGTPGPVLQMALRHNAEAGATVRVVERHLGGCDRALATSAP